jgi:GMP synthase-like glutamine amidotransferase
LICRRARAYRVAAARHANQAFAVGQHRLGLQFHPLAAAARHGAALQDPARRFWHCWLVTGLDSR